MGVAFGLAVTAKKQLALRGFDVDSRNLDAWLKIFQKAVCLHRVNLNSVDDGTILDAIQCVSAHVEIPGLVFICLSVRHCASLVIPPGFQHDQTVHPSVQCIGMRQRVADMMLHMATDARSASACDRHIEPSFAEPQLHFP